MADLASDDRAIAFNILVFVVGLVVAAGMIIVFNEPIEMIINQGQSQSSSTAASNGWDYVDLAWQAFPLAALILATIGLIADSQFFRRVRR